MEGPASPRANEPLPYTNMAPAFSGLAPAPAAAADVARRRLAHIGLSTAVSAPGKLRGTVLAMPASSRARGAMAAWTVLAISR
mmetsp:Transcript_79650/g.258018  ORF Transcript_79650/g.258018 Transcript_79650/m.258018 type:complete len:83 (-) Transcript_79650:823-1071(-)